MTPDRCKQIMEQLGMPNSRSLQQALYQIANETDQEAVVAARRRILALIEQHKQIALNEGWYPSKYRYIEALDWVIQQIEKPA